MWNYIDSKCYFSKGDSPSLRSIFYICMHLFQQKNEHQVTIKYQSKKKKNQIRYGVETRCSSRTLGRYYDWTCDLSAVWCCFQTVCLLPVHALKPSSEQWHISLSELLCYIKHSLSMPGLIYYAICSFLLNALRHRMHGDPQQEGSAFGCTFSEPRREKYLI